jgi:hypothetical protein
MRAVRVSMGVVLVALALGGCKKASVSELGPGRGRYAGIGIYDPGKSWANLVAGQQAKAGPAARLIDDSAVIVVEDSVTGEVRGCGNLTGYCVGMNPWKGDLTPGQTAPVPVSQHIQATEADPGASAAPAAPAERG